MLQIQPKMQRAAHSYLVRSAQKCRSNQLPYQLLTASVPVAEVGKPPDVSEADGEAQAGQQKLDLAAPVGPLGGSRIGRLIDGFRL